MSQPPKYSVIIPVYNRPDEIDDLLKSLACQDFKDFEVVITEDGSTVPSDTTVAKYTDTLQIQYFTKTNEGRSMARNHSIAHARGQWLVFFDSDCVIPADYFTKLDKCLTLLPTDCFGGPDAAHPSFTVTQKAINFAMTSFLTTGGIRGGRKQLEKFTPRTFNMGFTKEVCERVGGFREMFSEDIDMSKRIEAAGYKTTLFPDLFVFHKRRGTLTKFFRQVHIFGMSRITLRELYPGSLKMVHTLPALAVMLAAGLILTAALTADLWWLSPFAIWILAVFVTALCKNRSLTVALLAVPASIYQITGYGTGFIRAWVKRSILGKRRNVDDEIKLRKGK